MSVIRASSDATPSSTGALLQRSRSGDPDATRTLAGRIAPDLLRQFEVMAAGEVGNRTLETDAVTSTLTEILRNSPRFVLDDPRGARQLLARMIANSLSHRGSDFRLRRRNLAKKHPLPAGESLHLSRTRAEVGTHPDGVWVRMALEVVDPEDRDLIVAARFEHVPISEIATALGVGTGEAQVRVSRALVKLTHAVGVLKAGRIAKFLNSSSEF